MWQGKEYENIFHLPDGGQVLPVCIVRQLLYPISSNEFLDVINAHSDEDIHMCTVCENDFLRYEYVYCGKLRLFYFDEYENFIVHEDFKKPTFKQYTDEQIIELEEFIAWIHRNKEYVISLKGRLIDEYAITAEKPEAQDSARVAKLEEELARAQEENKRLMDENQALRLQLAEKREAGSQGVDATQVEALRKELESTKQALKTATKAPAPQAMGTYWLLLYVLFREQGIDCRTIDFSTSKTRYATDLEKKIHGIGCTLDDKTIRAKMKEVQAYMDKEKNG